MRPARQLPPATESGKSDIPFIPPVRLPAITCPPNGILKIVDI
jgi:hypothetical protein